MRAIRQGAGWVGPWVWLASALCAGCIDDRSPGSDADPIVLDPPADTALDSAPDGGPADGFDASPDAVIPNRCPQSCERIVACAIEGCDALAAADAPELVALCLDRCAELPSVGPVVAGLNACDEIDAFTAQAVPGILDACVFDPAFPPAEPLCRTYGERLAECLVPVCAPAADHRAVLAAGFAHECDVAVAGGADPSGIAAIADAPCAAWREAAEERVGADLAAFCSRGPLDTPEACRTACATAAECLNPNAEANQPFRNPDRCTMLCIASTNAPRGWACLAERMTCDAIEPCFARGPEPLCRVEADRVVECVQAACEPVAPLADGLRALLVVGCDTAVADRSRALADVEAAATAEGCGDGALATRVGAVLDRPDDPTNALAPTCVEGPRDPALCAPACAALGRCLDPGNVLTDAAICGFYCGTTAVYDDPVWRCGGEAGGCEATVRCFTDAVAPE